MSAGPEDTLAVQRARLRRILWAFLAVVLLLPLVGLGGRWTLLLVPLLAIAAFALCEALRIHRAR